MRIKVLNKTLDRKIVVLKIIYVVARYVYHNS